MTIILAFPVASETETVEPLMYTMMSIAFPVILLYYLGKKEKSSGSSGTGTGTKF